MLVLTVLRYMLLQEADYFHVKWTINTCYLHFKVYVQISLTL